jgi:AraC-like DNA-binding protein
MAEKQGKRDPLVAEAVRRIVAAKGNSDVASLARELGLSLRQLERRFHSVVGLPPKLFCRIQRLNSVLRTLEQPSRNWVETALACGYYDQAHLIRDCNRLTGSTPAVLLAGDADLARHFYQRFGLSHSSNTGRRHFLYGDGWAGDEDEIAADTVHAWGSNDRGGPARQ